MTSLIAHNGFASLIFLRSSIANRMKTLSGRVAQLTQERLHLPMQLGVVVVAVVVDGAVVVVATNDGVLATIDAEDSLATYERQVNDDLDEEVDLATCHNWI